MLQLKDLVLIRDLTGVEAWQFKPVKFGYSVAYAAAASYVLAAEVIAANTALLVTRVQCYLTNIDNTSSDYLLYRMPPEGTAQWILSMDAAATVNLTSVTNPGAPGHLPLDCDEILLFPEGPIFANLLFVAAAAAPAAGTWRIRTTVFGYFVGAEVYETLTQNTDWINVQQ